MKNASLTPAAGGYQSPIAPPAGVSAPLSTPSAGAMEVGFDHFLTPAAGDYLDIAISPIEQPKESNDE